MSKQNNNYGIFCGSPNKCDGFAEKFGRIKRKTPVSMALCFSSKVHFKNKIQLCFIIINLQRREA